MGGVVSGGVLPPEEFAALVREVVRDTLPSLLIDRLSAVAPAPAGTSDPGEVRVATQEDLDAVVRRVAGMCEDPTTRALLRDGRLRLRLAPAASDPGRPPPATGRPVSGGPSQRIATGAVTEAAVRRAHAAGGRLVVGPRAVVTPLAKDRARVLGVTIDRESE
jgi:hypothetical protein